MKRYISYLTAAGVGCGLIVGAAIANEHENQKQQTSSDSKKLTEQQLKDNYLQTSKLIGKKIKNSSGETVGTIKDVIVSLESQSSPFAIVDCSQMFQEKQRVAVPLNALKADNEGNIMLNASKEQLQSSTMEPHGHWIVVARQPWTREVDRYYGQPLMEHHMSDVARGPDRTDRQRITTGDSQDREYVRQREQQERQQRQRQQQQQAIQARNENNQQLQSQQNRQREQLNQNRNQNREQWSSEYRSDNIARNKLGIDNDRDPSRAFENDGKGAPELLDKSTAQFLINKSDKNYQGPHSYTHPRGQNETQREYEQRKQREMKERQNVPNR